jgi:cytoskeletal protein CcmA (bactofilin family)
LFKRRKPEDGPEAPDEKLEVGMPPPSLFPSPGRADDKSAGTVPNRPVSKESLSMARPPFPGQPQPQPQPQGGTPGGGPAPVPGMPPRPGMMPQAAPRPVGAERRTLVVGRGISVQGTVQDAERLVVEGTVEASMIRATELSIAHGGIFKGAVEVEEAEIAGTIDGTLTARGNLIVRATGKVLGTANYRRLQVEDGGQITGELKMISEGGGRSESSRPAIEITGG